MVNISFCIHCSNVDFDYPRDITFLSAPPSHSKDGRYLYSDIGLGFLEGRGGGGEVQFKNGMSPSSMQDVCHDRIHKLPTSRLNCNNLLKFGHSIYPPPPQKKK